MNQDFSVDLASAAADHLKMLREVHTCGLDLYRAGNDLERAVEIYKQWLPTADVDDGAAENVPPPIEVIWVHHLHRLNPTAYREDCLRCLGRIVHVEKPFAFSSSSCYTPSTRASAGNTPPAKGSIEIGFDIGEAAERQSTFLWQVRWQQYGQPKFIKLAVERYHMMLALKKTYHKLFVVPTYDMDIIWHTHLGFTRAYEKDCERIVGWILTHDDTVNDRSEGSKLNTCSDHTVRLWSKEYATPWRRKGGMYVGEPPSWFWSDREKAAGEESSAGPTMTGPPSPGPPMSMGVMTAGAAMGNDGRLDLPPLQTMGQQLPVDARWGDPASPAIAPSHLTVAGFAHVNGMPSGSMPTEAVGIITTRFEQERLARAAGPEEPEKERCCCCYITKRKQRPSAGWRVKLTAPDMP